ncbi:MAG TPA: hypothetical protein VFQ53_36660 [Kofleriaceae bacterium]|nr:hypothetical protein [Kofleriaceae bacterium]
MRSADSQKVVPFTGEGAYHGSTKPRPAVASAPPAVPPPPVDEMRPTTLEDYAARGVTAIETFDATFPDRYEIVSRLPVPTQDEIRSDGVTFVWAPFEQALAEAGPLTRRVLEAMQTHLVGTKRHIYIDSKIQYFEAGDVPVDSRHWHVDGSITTRGPAVSALGFGLLHDMRARVASPALAPQLLSYQSSDHCATEYATEPVTVRLPELIANFDELDALVRARGPATIAQPASSILRFDGLSLHRAVAARAAGWRLWVRCMETDREVHLNPAIVECYGTVFRLGAAS